MTMLGRIRLLLLGWAVLFSAVSVTAQEKIAEEKSQTDESVERLKFMKDSASVYQFTTGQDDSEALKLLPDPALRWTNPVSGLKDGTLYFWVNQEGRPYAAAQVFQIESGIWLHEFQSLTTASFRVARDRKTIWSPRQAGVEWKPVPEGPIPAKSPALRLSQMKSIVERFGANDDFEGKSRWELRLLTKPLLRYASTREGITDGATFAFVHTTDPEVFVTLEVVQKDSQEPGWRYSLAPMTAYALKVTLDGDTVWEKPWAKDSQPVTAPYQILVYKP